MSGKPVYNILTTGDPAPWFKQRNAANPTYDFASAAGRYILLGFYLSAGDAAGRAALEAVKARPDLFNDIRASFFGVSVDPADETSGQVQDTIPGIRHFWDFDARVSRLYGAIPADPAHDSTLARRFWMLLDPMLRVIRLFPMAADNPAPEEMFAFIAALPPLDRAFGPEIMAPVLWLPNVFEPDLCRALIDLHTADGGTPSGFMRDIDGKTVLVTDPKHKVRRDITVTDERLIAVIRNRITRRVHPEILKVHQFDATRMERYLVGCYTDEEAGHFRAHRDNTTPGTAHRRFAVSINLNADFEGGEIGFPEYGPRRFKPAPGGAVVFSCSLLHEVSPVTQGRRYAFLPFLYDDAAAQIRARNSHTLEDDIGNYTYKDA